MCCHLVLTTPGAIRYYNMLESAYRTSHNLVFIEPVRIGYASSEKEASDLARVDSRRSAVYDRRGCAAHENHPADCPTLDTRGEAQSHRGWRAIPCQAGSLGSLPTRALARRQKNSASPNRGRYIVADAAMETPWQKYTLLRPRKQHRWTVRPSETPGLPSWAGGSGSGSALTDCKF
jgi:hypothetical protein